MGIYSLNEGLGEISLRPFLRKEGSAGIPIVFQRTMATGSATSAGLGLLKVGRNIPAAKRITLLTGQLFTIAGMGFMTKAAGPPFAVIGDMNKMKVAVAIAEIGVEGGFLKLQHFPVVALQTKFVEPFLVRHIQPFRVGAGQHPEIIGTVGVVTRGTKSFREGTMERLLPL